MTRIDVDKACRHLARARMGLPFVERYADPERLAEADPLLALAARVILSGDRMAVIRLREADPAARLLLDRLATDYRPPQALIDRQRAQLASSKEERQQKIIDTLRAGAAGVDDGAQLVRGLFERAGEAVQLGTGRFPDYVAHTCGGGYVATIERRADGTNPVKLAPAAGKAWRHVDGAPVCKACYDARVRRQALQALAEANNGPVAAPTAIYLSAPVPAHVARRQLAAWRKRRQRGGDDLRYRTLPQAGGAVVILHTDPERDDPQLPQDRGALFVTLYPYCDTPEGARVGGNNDWGQEFQGMRGDGRRKQAAQAGDGAEAEQPAAAVVDRLQVWVKRGSIVKAAEALGIELNKRKRGRAADIDPAEAYQRLIELGHEPRIRGGLQRLADFVGADVTLNAHGTEDDPVSLKRDTDGRPPDPPAVYLPGMGDIQ